MSELMADIVGGVPQESEEIEIFDLVCQREGYLYKASQDDETKPCEGVVYTELNGKYYHIRHGVLEGVSIEGSYVDGVVYFGADGKLTFERPTSGYIQVIGLAFYSSDDDTYSVMFNICPTVDFV